jgi:hypothetical protein
MFHRIKASDIHKLHIYSTKPQLLNPDILIIAYCRKYNDSHHNVYVQIMYIL